MRVKALILVPLVAVALTSCAAQVTPAPASTEAVTEKPLFATDEEALAAAQAAYANYLEVSDQIARDGGANPERLKGLVSSDLYLNEVQGFEELANSGFVAKGTSTFDELHVQEISHKYMTAYLCVDHSNINIFDDAGQDVTSSSRIDRYPLVVTFASSSSGALIVNSSDSWSGQNYCL